MSIYFVSSDRPFSLPLGRDDLETALRKGHGRALLHVRHHGATGIDDLIVDACLHDKTFDPQCEGDRTRWMIEIMDAASLEDVVCEKIVDSIRVGGENFWDTNHLCRIAVIFARRGHSAARSALYAALHKNEDSADLIAAEEIIELDGAEGLLFVSERIGEWLAGDLEMAVGDAPLLWYDEHKGRGSAERVLMLAAKQNDRIAAYLKHICSQRDGTCDSVDQGRRRDHSKPDILRFGARGRSSFEPVYGMSPDELIHFVEAGTPGFAKYALSGWGRRATEDALRQVVDRMFRESNPDRLARFLGIFQRRSLPEFDSRLLRFAEHPDHDVRWVTISVLANHQHPDVRALAQDRVRAGCHNDGELRLFCKNFEQGDWSLIRSSLRWPADENELHRMLDDLLEVFENEPGEESREALLLVYEHSPCSRCRGVAVKALCKRKRAPDWLLEECRFDADEEIRSSVTDVPH